nr:MAG TPA: nucleoside triphosphate pyrophosphohydrolase [Caudoviricetes sp.]
MLKQVAEALGKFIKENMDIIEINENDEVIIKSIDLEKCIRNAVKEETTFLKAIARYGAEEQEGVAQEECAELIQAISKKHRGKPNNIAEEIADVEIMLEQLKIINGCENEVKEIRKQKISRLQKNLSLNS